MSGLQFPNLPGGQWKDGFIYYVMSPETGRMKIGFTRGHPAKRLKALQTGSPTKLGVVAYHPGDEETERRLHAEFKADRLHGEWFDISDDLLVHMAGVYNFTIALYQHAELPAPAWAEVGIKGIMSLVDDAAEAAND